MDTAIRVSENNLRLASDLNDYYSFIGQHVLGLTALINVHKESTEDNLDHIILFIKDHFSQKIIDYFDDNKNFRNYPVNTLYGEYVFEDLPNDNKLKVELTLNKDHILSRINVYYRASYEKTPPIIDLIDVITSLEKMGEMINLAVKLNKFNEEKLKVCHLSILDKLKRLEKAAEILSKKNTEEITPEMKEKYLIISKMVILLQTHLGEFNSKFLRILISNVKQLETLALLIKKHPTVL